MEPLGYDENNDLIYPDGVEPIVIRTTDRGNFKKCRVLWDYNSKMRMGREPTKSNVNLAFGIAIHKGLEAYYDPVLWHHPYSAKATRAVLAFTDDLSEQYKAANQARELSDEEWKECEELIELGQGMLRHYAQWAPQQDKGWTPVAVEQRFQVPVPRFDGGPLITKNDREGTLHPVVYQVRLDLVVRDADGNLRLVDHKTAIRFDDLTHLELDTQLSSYLWAYYAFTGEVPKAVIYNQLAKRVPQPPKILKSGLPSKDKSQATTYEMYLDTLTRLGLDTGPYEGILDFLAAQQDNYFRRTHITRTLDELALQERYIRDESIDMASDPAIYPNPSLFHCRGCDFLVPCMVRNEGGDDLFILNDAKFYRMREE